MIKTMKHVTPKPVSDVAFAHDQRPRVVVLGAGNDSRIATRAEALRPTIEKFTEIVAWDLGFHQDLSKTKADLAIVLGGDGSILRSVHQMGYQQLPVMGVNLGKLGFLADVAPDELPELLPKICAGEFRVAEHLMAECSLLRGKQHLSPRLVLNEVVIRAGPPFRIVDIDLYIDGDWVTTYSCDGLIISTPVGSTAHGLSAGGPILANELQAMAISPISPHTLTNRPVVDSADRVYEMAVAKPLSGTAAVVDGTMLDVLQPEDRLRVRRCKACFKRVEVPGHSYYRTLREKLGWGGRLNPGR